jgi:hypothetical protein
MRLLKDRVLYVWQQRMSEAKDRATEVQRRANAVQEKLDRLDIDHHAESIEELDVQGILAFAERVLPRASDLWVQASLNQNSGSSNCFSRKGSAPR